MRLINVRKGQFVYYQNRLHKVYSVKPFFKQSVHLIRLSDFEQVLATAKEIDLYRPQHLDSFICNHERYTLDKDVRPEIGDYILVIDPRPDSLDHHHLHAIEMVASIESNGIISHKGNGIKHNEYWVMVKGQDEKAQVIDWQHPDSKEQYEDEKSEEALLNKEKFVPKVGDVFQKNDSDPVFHAMIVAINDDTAYLGGNIKVSTRELIDSKNWSLVMNVLEK